MPLHGRKEFEDAVEALLAPRHYEYLLFMQRRLENVEELDGVEKKKHAREVMRMVQSASPRIPTLGVDQAIDVLEEAAQRLKSGVHPTMSVS